MVDKPQTTKKYAILFQSGAGPIETLKDDDCNIIFFSGLKDAKKYLKQEDGDMDTKCWLIDFYKPDLFLKGDE